MKLWEYGRKLNEKAWDSFLETGDCGRNHRHAQNNKGTISCHACMLTTWICAAYNCSKEERLAQRLKELKRVIHLEYAPGDPYIYIGGKGWFKNREADVVLGTQAKLCNLDKWKEFAETGDCIGKHILCDYCPINKVCEGKTKDLKKKLLHLEATKENLKKYFKEM